MTLTVVVGASGSGKTTFLNQVHDTHHCTYLRQYHTIRPYIIVSKIPNFNPRKLPYWEIYVREGKDQTIVAGGTYGGKFVAGLSGGQRKLLLFEMVYQRCRDQSQLLIVLDEPFAGVTDGFVPFVVDRLNKLRRKHNILLVTNDHVETLTKMADNTITVSAIDRTKVKVNEEEGIDRNLVLIALSVGYEYEYQDSDADRKFFIDVEITSNKSIRGILAFTLIAFVLFIATFWGSNAESAALTLIAAGVISFFCIQPYLVTLTDWRDCMLEEAEALVHASPGKSKALKASITVIFIFIISVIQFFALNIATNFEEYMKIKFWIGMLGELFSVCFPAICLGIFSSLPFQVVQLLSGLPFLLVVFFSTTYSPGAGVKGLKALRYLFSRFYYFCMIPSDQFQLEGCPENETVNILLLILTSLISLFIFLAVLGMGKLRKDCAKQESIRLASDEDALEVERLQEKMYSNDETIISLCAPPSGLISNERNPTVLRPDPSGIHPRYRYPNGPKFSDRSDRSGFFGMSVIGA